MESWRDTRAFSERERLVLEFAERMTRSDEDVDDRLFGSLSSIFSEAELVELGAWVALQSFYSSFNRTFRIRAQGLSPLASRRPPGP